MKRPLDNSDYQPERNLRAYQGALYHSPQPFEINELVYKLLSHVDDRATLYNINNVSKRCHFVVQTFLQNSLKGFLPLHVFCKKFKINIPKLIEYAKNNNFSLDNIKNIFVESESVCLSVSWFLTTFKNIEYLSLNKCKINLTNLSDNINYPLKTLDLSFCESIFGKPLHLTSLEVCHSLEKLKVYKCDYDDYSLNHLFSKEKFSQRKLTLIWQNGDKYCGYFKNGKCHGKGRVKRVNGDIYDGYFKEGFFHGEGTLKYADGTIYEGHFENGKPHGK